MFRWLWFGMFMMANGLCFAQNNLQTLSAYRIVLLELEGNAAQRFSLEQAIYQNLQKLPNFSVSHQSLIWLGQQAKREELANMQQLLLNSEQELSKLKSGAYPNLKRVQELQRQIKRQTKKLEQHRSQSPNNYRIAHKLPIEVQRRSISRVGEEEKQEFGVNFWIYGQAISVESQRVFLELKGYDVMLDEEIVLYSGTFGWNMHQEVVARAIDTARERLLGRPWAAVEITGVPTANYRIQWQDLEGKPRIAALPQAYLENLELDSGRLRFYAVGYQRQEWILLLNENERRSLRFNAVPSQADDRFIQANLPDARVYLDGIYQGLAPLTVQASAGQAVTITDPLGQRAPLIYVVKEEQEEIFLSFGLTVAEQRELIARQQKRFYLWAGVFIVSLVLPIVFYNMHLDYKQKAQRYGVLGEFDRQSQSLKTANMYTYLTIGTGVLSGGLLGVAIYQLYRYVDVSKNPPADEEQPEDQELE